MSASDEVLSKGPCPKCGSKDNCVTYADGHQYCFTPGCGHRVKAGGAVEAPKAKAIVGLQKPPQSWGTENLRGLLPATLRRFGYFAGTFNGKPAHYAPYYSQSGELVSQKVRLEDKSFPVLKAREDAPSIGECQLFGRHVFGDKFDRRVVITEGEIDAMTVAQGVDFKCATVSINTGAAGAAKCLKANYLWLDRFEEIVLWFDDDEPGRKAAAECAPLFKVGKVRIARADGAKDANELLKQRRPGDIEATIYAAPAWRPRGIVNAKENPKDVMAPTERAIFWEYPPMMRKLQEMTGGIHAGEVIYHVAGTGIGKSSVFREIEYHLVQQGVKIAVLSFEDTVRDAKLGIMSIAASERLHLVPVPDLDDAAGRKKYDARMRKIHDEVFGSGLIELFDPETAEWSMDAIMGYVRYCAKALECKVIFIDPISFIAAGIDLTADERRVLDRIAMEFAKLSKELGVSMQIAHHLKRTQGVPHEEGAPVSLNELRSSGGLANFAMGVIGWERNNQAEGDAWRVTRSRLVKPPRRTGRSGIADTLYYQDSGRLIESSIPFPAEGKPGASKDQPRRFGVAHDEY